LRPIARLLKALAATLLVSAVISIPVFVISYRLSLPTNQTNIVYLARSSFEGTVAVVGGIAAFAYLVYLVLEQRDKVRASRLISAHPNLSSFSLVSAPKSNTLPSLIFQNDPSAIDIEYQAGRDNCDNVTEELVHTLKKVRCLLVIGPSGIGKTKEVLRLAEQECLSGWMVLVYTGGWIGRPARWPENVPHHRILVVVDDVHHYCAPGIMEQHLDMNDRDVLDEVSTFHDGLHEFLSYLEAAGEREIRVIGTARSEDEYWKHLHYEQHPVWKRFAIYRLPPITDTNLVSLLKSYALYKGVEVREPEELIQRSDRMPQTIVGNVNHLSGGSETKRHLDLAIWANSADRTWRDIYEEIEEKIPFARQIYDAAYLTRSFNLPLVTTFILNMAIELTNRKPSRRLLHQIRSSFTTICRDYPQIWPLKDGEVQLRDGVLEGKDSLPQPEEYFHIILRVAQTVAREYPETRALLTSVTTVAPVLTRSSIDELDEGIHELLLIAQTIFARKGKTNALLFEVEEETNTLVLSAAVGHSVPKLVGYRLPKEGGLVGRAFQLNNTIVVEDLRGPFRYVRHRRQSFPETRSILTVPIIANDKSIAVLSIQSSIVQPRVHSLEAISQAEQIAAWIARILIAKKIQASGNQVS
jgi:putative methionine-R-sulfoxide reductase with GAF domain